MRRFEDLPKAVANLRRKVAELDRLTSRKGHRHGRADRVAELVTGFTNTSFASLDNLTTSAFTRDCEVTVETGEEALVLVSARSLSSPSGDTLLASFAVSNSGGIYINSNDNTGIRNASATPQSSTYVMHQTGLTPGSNTFTMSARVNTGTGQLAYPSLTVIPL